MNDRLITVATFDITVEAHIALNALQEAGVWANLSGENTVGNLWSFANADSGIKLVVREVDAAQAMEVIGPLASVRTGNRLVSDEELERQALEAAPYDGEETPPDPEVTLPAVTTSTGEETPIDPDKYAWRAFWLAWFGFFYWPMAFYTLYLFLQAALGPGELSRLGRNRPGVAAGVLLLAVIPAALSISFTGQILRR